jgi:hypothetical protein
MNNINTKNPINTPSSFLKKKKRKATRGKEKKKRKDKKRDKYQLKKHKCRGSRV